MKNQLIKRFLHLMYPTRCPVCSELIDFGSDFCRNCSEKLNLWNSSFSIERSSGFIAAYVYDENISPAIILLKNGVCGNAPFALGKALAEKIKAEGIDKRIDILIPVPMHKKDERKRGYNQAVLIASEISRQLGIPVVSKAVRKQKITEEQKNLNRQERSENLKGAFSIVHPDEISEKRIMLIDDVATTGSTLSQLTDILLKNNAAEVYCAACCKTPSAKNTEEV